MPCMSIADTLDSLVSIVDQPHLSAMAPTFLGRECPPSGDYSPTRRSTRSLISPRLLWGTKEAGYQRQVNKQAEGQP